VTGARYAIGALAFAGFAASAGVHVASLAGLDVQAQWPAVWSLHLGFFVVFLPFVISSRKRLGARPGLAALRENFPAWLIAAAGALTIYAIVNFVLFAVHGLGGTPAIVDGKYVLQNHGHLVREIGRAEFLQAKVMELRGFSGHWMIFYFIPFAYFMFSRRPTPYFE